MRIKTIWNAHEFDKFSEKNDGTTQTVQDLNYSIREIVAMAARGIAPPVGNEPSFAFPPGYDPTDSDFELAVKESDFDDFDAMDYLRSAPDQAEAQGAHEEQVENGEPAQQAPPNENQE